MNYLDEASLEDEVPEGFSEDELKMEIKKQAKQILRRIGYTFMPGVF